MGGGPHSTIRLRHYTRSTTLPRILTDGRLIAGDQNKVFVERADRGPLSPREAEARSFLKRGKGNACLEFDARADEIHQQTNRLTGKPELFLRGDVILDGRNPVGIERR